jgi:hypothetical protein
VFCPDAFDVCVHLCVLEQFGPDPHAGAMKIATPATPPRSSKLAVTVRIEVFTTAPTVQQPRQRARRDSSCFRDRSTAAV